MSAWMRVPEKDLAKLALGPRQLASRLLTLSATLHCLLWSVINFLGFLLQECPRLIELYCPCVPNLDSAMHMVNRYLLNERANEFFHPFPSEL